MHFAICTAGTTSYMPSRRLWQLDKPLLVLPLTHKHFMHLKVNQYVILLILILFIIIEAIEYIIMFV